MLNMSQVDNRTVFYGGEVEWRGDLREYSTVGSFMGTPTFILTI
jgi:hypothetical protein